MSTLERIIQRRVHLLAFFLGFPCTGKHYSSHHLVYEVILFTLDASNALPCQATLLDSRRDESASAAPHLTIELAAEAASKDLSFWGRLRLEFPGSRISDNG